MINKNANDIDATIRIPEGVLPLNFAERWA